MAGGRQRAALWAGLLLALALAPGCSIPSRLHSPTRQQYGLVLILPGIEGKSILNRNLALGLNDGGVRSAIEVYDWTTRLPGTMVLNLTDYERNERKAREIAGRVRSYQRAHRGRPVHLVGHSGGGGIAVLTLEALKHDEEIEQALLLGPALSREYDLTRALKRARNGIVNFYSESDVALLRVGTAVAGTIDREHGASAGALGFLAPPGISADGRRLYKDRLRQVGWSERLERYGASGTHIGWTSSTFAKRYLAEVIKRNERAALERLAAPALAGPDAIVPEGADPDAPDAQAEDARADN